jgi:2-methylisocitrate lyase-like PEP mutase family enzyme
MPESQLVKAEQFRKQHAPGKLLVLPNIWDPLGARLMEKIGYPSVATASVATALAGGYADGENIPFSELLKLVKKISAAVDVPLSVDIERGFADNISLLKENIMLLIENGGVGINLEDSKADESGLYSIEEQCRKIEAVRETGIQCGVPIVINARTDIFLRKVQDDALGKAVERAKAYQSAGADCVYPIMINNYEDIVRFVEAVKMPVNVNLLKPISDLRRLEKIGVARVSVGPQLLNHVLATMKTIGESLMQYDTGVFFGRELLPREYLNGLILNEGLSPDSTSPL